MLFLAGVLVVIQTEKLTIVMIARSGGPAGNGARIHKARIIGVSERKDGIRSRLSLPPLAKSPE